ncbi:uncharacterized protein N7515_009202 [Penicillium bovifimosum]|uniref:Uncharacterized protein n=1 Tax=Penicillium bovifimosum TaxID=126998 RepID=A0A9W9GJ93_9EURO|nr:uncharacterized protein N7515_009202 [Penicillium bovifimosum]KAJ5121241.1 hypothetical protein N7515_009202 [Penicillium bovifimosum]
MEHPSPVNKTERLARGEEAIEKAEAEDKGTDHPGEKARMQEPSGNAVSLDSDHALRADVPDFVPGMPSSQAGPPSSAPSTKGKGKARQPRAPPQPPKVTTKSTADDLATRIHEDISHNLTSPRATLAGVIKKSILNRFLVYPHTHVVRLARGLARDVRIHVMQLVMQVHVRLVLPWAQRRIASVVLIRRKNVVKTQIMKMAGAVVRSAVSYCRAENTHVHFHVMRDCAVAARLALTLVAIVGNLRWRCSASRKMMRRTVESSLRTDQKMNGPAASIAGRLVTVPLIVAFIHVRRTATRRSLIQHTVHDHRMLSSIALVARRRYLRYRDIHLGLLAKTPF